jgi:hypothetical protein
MSEYHIWLLLVVLVVLLHRVTRQPKEKGTDSQLPNPPPAHAAPDQNREAPQVRQSTRQASHRSGYGEHPRGRMVGWADYLSERVPVYQARSYILCTRCARLIGADDFFVWAPQNPDELAGRCQTCAAFDTPTAPPDADDDDDLNDWPYGTGDFLVIATTRPDGRRRYRTYLDDSPDGAVARAAGIIKQPRGDEASIYEFLDNTTLAPFITSPHELWEYVRLRRIRPK